MGVADLLLGVSAGLQPMSGGKPAESSADSLSLSLTSPLRELAALVIHLSSFFPASPHPFLYYILRYLRLVFHSASKSLALALEYIVRLHFAIALVSSRLARFRVPHRSYPSYLTLYIRSILPESLAPSGKTFILKFSQFPPKFPFATLRSWESEERLPTTKLRRRRRS